MTQELKTAQIRVEIFNLMSVRLAKYDSAILAVNSISRYSSELRTVEIGDKSVNKEFDELILNLFQKDPNCVDGQVYIMPSGFSTFIDATFCLFYDKDFCLNCTLNFIDNDGNLIADYEFPVIEYADPVELAKFILNKISIITLAIKA